MSRVSKKIRYISLLQAWIAGGILLFGFLGGHFLWLAAVLCVAVFSIAIWAGLILPEEAEEEMVRQKLKSHKQSLEMLSHYRHDVMNQIQLLKGYLQLQIYDRLQAPIQKLVNDAQRHSVLSNLPGNELPYVLIKRELAAPMLHLQLEIEDKENWKEHLEQEIVTFINYLSAIGENLSQDLGIIAEWNMKLRLSGGAASITLAVLGEHVNNTYIAELIEEFGRKGLTLLEQTAEGQTHILSFGSQVKPNVR
ncbi:Spo0B domain-containing protein [Effusibacillus lacus]|uniref:SpoOB alpha-helical domain-containing protein n=1 Tax=Effusibacillus lacus TaxID=1348429 RepID=A0A292YP48_9BACL|nr:Spo0B domain-containing protein [Effusibacillus lacus]TCS75633.1 sensor kinase SpoOB-type protein [Effusibacillus lacus]GAX90956.1 hypothetical protein EFBL_2616 [Effusibacillus lacus]